MYLLFHVSYLKYHFLDTFYPLLVSDMFVHAQESLEKVGITRYIF